MGPSASNAFCRRSFGIATLDPWAVVTLSAGCWFSCGREPWVDAPLHLSEDEVARARRIVGRLDKALGADKLLVGDTGASFIRINHPVVMNTPPAEPHFMPLPFAIGAALVRASASAVLMAAGFRRRTDPATGFVAWHWPNQSWEGAELPPRALVVIPGFGFGAIPYLPFILSVRRRVVSDARHRAFIVVEPAGLSGHPMRPLGENDLESGRGPYPTPEAIAAYLAGEMAAAECEAMDVIAHSYGTMLTSHLSR